MSRNFVAEETLIDQLHLDDTDSFEELYHRNGILLYTYCLDKLNSPDDARRIVREIFVDLWENRKSLPVGFSISIHLYTEVRKKIIQCINEKLNENKDIDIIQKQIIPGFNVLQLKKARQPVKAIPDERNVIPAAIIYKKQQAQNNLDYYLKSFIVNNVRHAFQKVMHFW